MALAGNAFLVLWSDVLPAADAEWRAWHVREHMPDRLTVPGIEVGRRYLDPTRPRHQTFMMYEARSLDVFRSAPYLAQMNAPSVLTQKMLPSIRNILRGVCRTVASDGLGVGTVVAAMRVARAEPDRPIVPDAAAALVEAALDLPGVIGSHLGMVDRATTGIPSTEQRLRHDADENFDALLLLEGADRADITHAAGKIESSPAFARLAPAAVTTGVYDLVYLLSAKTAG
ncbi:MAG TPA: hypothetical protein VMU42_02325 [Candidatus Sulfotelmatobacter sp.]|nr:hypothetical protein [Candidatus Sulfotelmatobacter sp.]